MQYLRKRVPLSMKSRTGTSRLTTRNLIQQRRLLELLERFYNLRLPNANRRLVVVPAGMFGSFQLRPQGGAIQSINTSQLRHARLSEFRHEFTALGRFILSALYYKTPDLGTTEAQVS